MRNCNSLCKNYKTEKGYLCDKKEPSLLSNKKWCKINTNDLNNYQRYLPEPDYATDVSSGKRYYWDYIQEENKQKMCAYNNEIKYNTCSLLENFKYYLGCMLMTGTTLSVTTAKSLAVGASGTVFTLGGKLNVIIKCRNKCRRIKFCAIIQVKI